MLITCSIQFAYMLINVSTLLTIFHVFLHIKENSKLMFWAPSIHVNVKYEYLNDKYSMYYLFVFIDIVCLHWNVSVLCPTEFHPTCGTLCTAQVFLWWMRTCGSLSGWSFTPLQPSLRRRFSWRPWPAVTTSSCSTGQSIFLYLINKNDIIKQRNSNNNKPL